MSDTRIADTVLEAQVVIEAQVGEPPVSIVDEFNKLWGKLSEVERKRLMQGTFEPVKPPHPARGHIAIRPTSPRLDPMTGGPLPSREAELRWLSGFSSSALCMASRPALRVRSRGTRISRPYVDFSFF